MSITGFRRIVSLFLCFCLILLLPIPGVDAAPGRILGDSDAIVAAQDGDGLSLPGRGTAASPLIIRTGQELYDFAWCYNNDRLPEGLPDGEALHIAVGDDLHLTGLDWEPIGNEERPFSGVFDGGGYAIDGLSVTGWDMAGLFGVLEGRVTGVTLRAAAVRGGTAGAVAGLVQGGVLEDCRADGRVEAATVAGGLVGWMEGGKIVLSAFEGSVSGKTAGGLVGQLAGGRLSGVYSGANVTGSEAAGGLVGTLSDGAALEDGVASGAVAARSEESSRAGGLVGLMDGGSLSFAYAVGPVEAYGGGARAGGLVGSVNGGQLSHCVAMAPSVRATTGAGSLWGEGDADFEGLVYWQAMILSGASVSTGGTGLIYVNLASPDTWTAFTDRPAWILADGASLPTLDGLAGMSGDLPGHMSGDVVYLHTVADLLDMAKTIRDGDEEAAGASYALAADINLTGVTWLPIGGGSTPFTGIFDGRDHVISGLSVTGDASYVGFFGVLDGATVKNLTLEGVQVQAAESVSFAGGLAGEMRDGLVENCAVSGKVQAGETQTAGLLIGRVVGEVAGELAATIYRCGVEGTVTAATAGGLVGIAVTRYASINLEACYSAATVKAEGDIAYAGGLVGHLEATEDAVLVDCYATGDVTAQSMGKSTAGGLVGFQSAYAGGSVSLCTSYATGAVQATGVPAYAGGLTGYAEDLDPMTWQNCAALNSALEATAQTGAVVGGTDNNSVTVENCFQWSKLAEGEIFATAVSAGGLSVVWDALTGSDSWQTPQEGELPILAEAAGRQRSALPPHLANPEAPVVISTVERLIEIAANINNEPTEGLRPYAKGAYKLGADLNLSGVDWTPIGSAAAPFSGQFDGDGHRITGLTVDDQPAAGFFGVLDGATVENLLLPGCRVTGTSTAGAVAGEAKNAVIRDCAASGRIAVADQAGGLVGLAEDATLKRLSFTGRVTGNTAAGGLVGGGTGNLEDSHSAGAVTGGESGGLAGEWAGNMTRCYTTASVNGDLVGGIVGRLQSGLLLDLVYLGGRSIPPVGEGANLDGVLVWEGSLSSEYDDLPAAANAPAFSAATFWRAGFWQDFDTTPWSLLPGKLPLLTYDLADGEPPLYLRGYPAADAALVPLCPEGENFPSSPEARTLPLEAVVDRDWQPVPLVLWKLVEGTLGPFLNVLDGDRAELTIPGDWVGAVTVLAGLDRWPDVTGSLTIHINGDLGQSGAAVHLEQSEARYGDRLTAVFAPPSGAVGAEGVTLDWLVDGVEAGSGQSILLDQADWIGRAVKVRARASNFASPVESSALLIGKRLYSGTVADPQEQARTGDSLTLTSLAGYEYACMEAGGNPIAEDWRQEAHFSGLTAGIAYAFYQRVAETADTEASPPSRPLSVTLEKDTGGGEDDGDGEEGGGDGEENGGSGGESGGEENKPSSEPDPGEDLPQEGGLPEAGDIPPAENSGPVIPASFSEREDDEESWGKSTPDTTSSAPAVLTSSRGISLARDAAQSARRNGADVALITLQNPGRIGLETMKAMAATAGMPLLIHADSFSGDNQVAVRISLNPARATKDLDLSATISSGGASSKESTSRNWAQLIRELFRRAYGSETAVISFGQRGDFGMAVEIAALLEIPGGDPVKLPYWSYQRTTGVYRRIKEVTPWRDSRGYIHFQTELAGDLVVGGPFRAR
jgi:hypothetical protein